MKLAIEYITSLLNTRCRLLMPKCSKKAVLSGGEVMFAGFPNKETIVEQINKLPLSGDTCTCRCEDLSGDVFKELLSKLRACPAWSIALDEGTE